VAVTVPSSRKIAYFGRLPPILSRVIRGLPLRTRLTLLIVFLLLPLQLVVLGSYARTASERRTNELDNATLIAENAAAAVEAFVRDIESTGVAMSTALSAVPLDQANAGAYLQRVIGGYPVLRSIFVTDLGGKVVATSSTGVGTDLAARPYVVSLRAGADPVWSGSLTGIQTGEVTVAFGRSITDAAGARRGFLIYAFYPDRLVTSLGLRTPADGDIALLDQNGLILYETQVPDLPAARRDASDSPEVRSALGGHQVRVDAERTAFGDGRYGAIVPIARNNWLLAFTRPVAPLDAALRERFALDAVAIGAVIALAALIAAIVAQRMTRPLSAMSVAAGAIARGERPQIPPVAQNDVEVARLGAAMRTMSSAIAEREDALRLLATASDVLSRSLDYDETLAALAKVVVPAIADWCIVDIIDERGPTRVSVVQADLAKVEVAARIARARVDITRSPARGVLARGEPLLLADVPDPASTPGITGEELDTYRAMQPRSLIVAPLVAQGKPFGLISFITAESGRRFDEDDLAIASEITRRAAIAIEHARLYKQLQESLRARDEFLSSAAHELKTPLTSIKGYAQTLERRARELDEPMRARFAGLQRIDAASTRMARTIDELLDLARLRLGQKIELDRNVADLVTIARDSVAEHAAMSAGHRISFDARVPSLIGEWDGRRLEHVISNLISNAVKFSPAGGDVVVTVDQVEGDAVLAVRDQGVGIVPEDRAAIFERFRRGSNVKGIPGTGIGLTLAKEIVQAHGGQVFVESAPGKGSTFTLRLPVSIYSPVLAEDRSR
jgi:signal transduction histidine kinase